MPPEWWSAVASSAPTATPRPASGPVAQGDPEAVIREVAGRYTFTDPDLLVATARQESSLNPLAVGDQGQSYGIFQEHSRGRGAGIPVASRQDVAAATERAIREFNAIRAKNPTADRGTWAALAQRPLDAQGYARSVNALLGASARGPSGEPGAHPGAVRPAPAVPTGVASHGPAWWAAVAGAGRPDGATPATGPGNRPLAGDVITKAGQPYWSFGGGAHAGIDIAAKAGTPVRSPVAGEVVANLAAGQNPLGLSKGYGRAVAVRDAGGDVHIFGHGAPDFGYLPVGAKVNVGDVVSAVGSPKTKLPGEASEGEHLHWEIRGGGDYGKQINPETWLPQQAVPATDTPRKAITTEPGPAWWSAVTGGRS